MSLNLTHDEKCDIRGFVVYQPCVPVTPVEGSGTLEFQVWTDDRNYFRVSSFENPDSFSNEPVNPTSIGTQWQVRYSFINTQNLAGCPDTESGTAILTKTS